MIVTGVLWGVGTNAMIEHAFPSPKDRFRRPPTPTPRSICGEAWAAGDPPQPADGLPQCPGCRTLAARLTGRSDR